MKDRSDDPSHNMRNTQKGVLTTSRGDSELTHLLLLYLVWFYLDAYIQRFNHAALGTFLRKLFGQDGELIVLG